MTDLNTTDLTPTPLTDSSDEGVVSPLPGLGPQEPAGGDDLLLAGDASAKRSPVAGALLIVIVMLVAVGALFAMRHIGTHGKLSFVEIDVHIPTQVASAERFDDVMSDIRSASVEVQVPIEQVKKNPFFIEEVDSSGVAPIDDDGPTEEEIEAQRRTNAILTAFDSLNLQSVSGGAHPLAIINNELRQIGDTIGGFFIIRAINDRAVDLTTDDGQAFQLSLGDEG
ncbi:MAG: hypothetical protein KAS72_14905 [Phycisphaerales bacterium]|nr:hypothetical protein [Phycisphaerales bacterium]